MLAMFQDSTDRKETERRVQQHLSRLALLHQLTRAMGGRQDLAGIFLSVLSCLGEDLAVAFSGVLKWGTGAKALNMFILGPRSHTVAATMDLAEQSTVTVDQDGLRTAPPGQTVYEPDTAQDSFPFIQGLRSLVLTPLMVEETVLDLF